jgi:hypothetical protein
MKPYDFVFEFSLYSSHLKTHKITSNETVATATFVAVTDYNVTEFSSRVSSAQQQGLDSYIKRENLGELLAKCVAKDGFSFHVVTNSSAI